MVHAWGWEAGVVGAQGRRARLPGGPRSVLSAWLTSLCELLQVILGLNLFNFCVNEALRVELLGVDALQVLLHRPDPLLGLRELRLHHNKRLLMLLEPTVQRSVVLIRKLWQVVEGGEVLIIAVALDVVRGLVHREGRYANPLRQRLPVWRWRRQMLPSCDNSGTSNNC